MKNPGLKNASQRFDAIRSNYLMNGAETVDEIAHALAP